MGNTAEIELRMGRIFDVRQARKEALAMSYAEESIDQLLEDAELIFRENPLEKFWATHRNKYVIRRGAMDKFRYLNAEYFLQKFSFSDYEGEEDDRERLAVGETLGAVVVSAADVVLDDEVPEQKDVIEVCEPLAVRL